MAQTTAASNYAGVWDNRLGFGRKTALIVIDLLQGYTLKGAPLFAPFFRKQGAHHSSLRSGQAQENVFQRGLHDLEAPHQQAAVSQQPVNHDQQPLGVRPGP